jgi:hypothetical protein
VCAAAAAVAASPVFGVPVGSNSSRWVSSSATGQCGSPLGTTNNSPGPWARASLMHTYRQPTLQNQEEVVRLRMRMRMPIELTLDLHHHDVVAIESGHCFWLPVFTESPQLLRQIDCVQGVVVVQMANPAMARRLPTLPS